MAVRAAEAPTFGTQWSSRITHAATLFSASADGGTVAAADARHFGEATYATVVVACSTCQTGEREVVVTIETVDVATGAISWTLNDAAQAELMTQPPLRIESALASPAGTAVDDSGRVYVADSWGHRIAVFAPSGAPLYTVGHFGAVYKLNEDTGYPDPEGVCYRTIGASLDEAPDPARCGDDPSQQLGEFNGPNDVAVSPDGQTIVVADSSNHRIQVLRRDDAAGSIVAATESGATIKFRAMSIGTWACGSAELCGDFAVEPVALALNNMSWPGGVALEPGTGRIVVADTDNSRVLVWDPTPPAAVTSSGIIVASDGVSKYTGFSFGEHGDSVPKLANELNYPLDVATGPGRRIVVVDSANNQVKVYNSAGVAIALLGEDPGAELGKFNYPSGASFTPGGDLLVADSDLGRVQWLKVSGNNYVPDGELRLPSVSAPFGVAFTPDGGLVVVENSGHDLRKLAPLGLEVVAGSVKPPAPDTILVGGQSAITFTARNAGEAPLQNVAAHLHGAGSMVPCDLDGVDGDAGNAVEELAPGQSHEFTICVTSGDAGTTLADLSVSVSGEGDQFVVESDAADVAPISVEAAAGAKLGVTVVAPSPILVGSPFDVTVTVKNQGLNDLHDVALVLASTPDSIGAATFLPLESDPLTASAIAARGQHVFHLRYEALAKGPLTLVATATAAELDDNQEPAHDSKTAFVDIQSDTLPARITSLSVVGPNGPPNAFGWIADPAPQQGARVIVTAEDPGDSGLRAVNWAILGSSTGGQTFAGEASATFATGPIFSAGQGRMRVAFWAEDMAGNSARLGLVPTGFDQMSLANYCAAQPTQCVNVNIDPLPPDLIQPNAPTISADRTEARIQFSATDSQSDVASVSLSSDQPAGTTARIEFEPNSSSRGTLILSSSGPKVFGKVTVVDFAGFQRTFELPLPGVNRPVLRLDSTPPEAFNRIDPNALGRSCTTTIDGLPVRYLCTNKVYGTDDLPGLTTEAFAPVRVVATKWGGDYHWSADSDHGHHHSPDGHWDDDHDGYCDNHRGQRLTDDHRYGYTSHDKDRDGHHDRNCREPHDVTDHSGHWDHNHDGYCDNHPGVRYGDDHRYAYSSSHDRNRDGRHDGNCTSAHDDDDDDHDWDHRNDWWDHDDGGHDRDDDYEHDWDGQAAELHTYTFTDRFVPAGEPEPLQSPNRVTLIEKYRQSGNEARVRVMGFKYNDGALIVPKWAYKKYEWAYNSDGSLKTLNQKYEIGHGHDREQVLANWDGKYNRTTIRELGPHPERKITVPGLVLLEMTTSSGRLKIRYDITRLVPIPDLVAPVLTVPSVVTAEATSSFGAVLNFVASAIDAVDGPVPVTCSTTTGTQLPLGLSTVTCTATDAAGNSASRSFTVLVRDTTAPVLTVPANIAITGAGSSGATVTFVATAVDTVAGARPVICAPASGSKFKVGTTNVTCTAADLSGNVATKSFSVSVKK